MSIRAAADERHPLDIEYERIAILNFTALSGNDGPGCKEYKKLRSLIPNGFYQSYDGHEYLVLGVERRLNRASRKEYYVALVSPLTQDPKGTCSVIIAWNLISDAEGWFNPVRDGPRRIPRFKLIQRLDLLKVAQEWRRKARKKI